MPYPWPYLYSSCHEGGLQSAATGKLLRHSRFQSSSSLAASLLARAGLALRLNTTVLLGSVAASRPWYGSSSYASRGVVYAAKRRGAVQSEQYLGLQQSLCEVTTCSGV